MFVYKHTLTIEYVKKVACFLRKIKTSRVNNSRILRLKNAEFSGYNFYSNTNIYGDFQICISVALNTWYLEGENTWSIIDFSIIDLSDINKKIKI